MANITASGITVMGSGNGFQLRNSTLTVGRFATVSADVGYIGDVDGIVNTTYIRAKVALSAQINGVYAGGFSATGLDVVGIGTFTSALSVTDVTASAGATGTFTRNSKTFQIYSGAAQVQIGTTTNDPLGIFINNGATVGQFTTTGLNACAIGATTASTGAFTTLSTSSLYTATGGIILPNTVTLAAKDTGGTTRNLLFLYSDNNVYLEAVYPASFLYTRVAGTIITTHSSTGLTVTGIISATGNSWIGASGGALRTINLDINATGTNDSASIGIRKKGTGFATLRLATVGDATGWDTNFNFPSTGDLSWTDIGTSTTRMTLSTTGLAVTGTITVSGNTSTFGSAGTGTNAHQMILRGGSGTGGGGLIYFIKDTTTYGQFGSRSFYENSNSNNIVLAMPTGSQLDILINGSQTFNVAASAALWRMTLGGGGTGSLYSEFIINGGSSTNGGGGVAFYKNSVAKAYIGLDSYVNGGTGDQLSLFAGAGIKLQHDTTLTGTFAQSVTGNVNAATFSTTATTANGINIRGDSYTTGVQLSIISNNGSASHTGANVEIINDFNAGAVNDLLYMRQDDDGRGINLAMSRAGVGLTISAGVTRTPISNSLAQFLGASGTGPVIAFETEASAGQFIYRRSSAAGAAVGNGDNLGMFAWRGAYTTNTYSGTMARIQAVTAQAWDAAGTTLGTNIEVGVCLLNDSSVTTVAAFTGKGLQLLTSTGLEQFAIDNGFGSMNIANNAVAYPFSNANVFSGLFIVNDQSVNGEVALFLSGGNGIKLVGQTGTHFTVSAGTASSINVYISSNAVVIENKLGVTVAVNATAIRTRVTN